MLADLHEPPRLPQGPAPAIPGRLRHHDSRQGVRAGSPGSWPWRMRRGLASLTAELVTVQLRTWRWPKPRPPSPMDARSPRAADATPDNVNAGVRKHFARCALTGPRRARCAMRSISLPVRWKSWTDPHLSAALWMNLQQRPSRITHNQEMTTMTTERHDDQPHGPVAPFRSTVPGALLPLKAWGAAGPRSTARRAEPEQGELSRTDPHHQFTDPPGRRHA